MLFICYTLSGQSTSNLDGIIGQHYVDGLLGSETDTRTSIKALRSLLDNDESLEIYQKIGDLYELLGEYNNAFQFFKLGVERTGSCGCHCGLANAYLEGKGVEVNYLKAESHFQSAVLICELNGAYHGLAKIAEIRGGLEESPERLISLYSKCCPNGDYGSIPNTDCCWDLLRITLNRNVLDYERAEPIVRKIASDKYFPLLKDHQVRLYAHYTAFKAILMVLSKFNQFNSLSTEQKIWAGLLNDAFFNALSPYYPLEVNESYQMIKSIIETR